MSGTWAPAGGRARILFVAANPSVDRLYEVDRLALGEIHRPRAVTAVAGGKGLNAARAAAALGGRVTAVGIVGGGPGEWIAIELDRLGISSRLVKTAADTRTCVSILDRSSGALTEVYERGAAIEATDWEALEAIVAAELAASDVAAIALSGSLPPGAPPDGFGRIARLAATNHDSRTGVRAAVLADSYGPALAAVLAERPAFVKVNAREAGEASAVEVRDVASAAEAARHLRDLGAGAAIVTLGPAGAVLATPEDVVHLVLPNVRGAYPVGSGDAVLGGLAEALARGAQAIDAVRLGLAAGTANALLPGAGVLDPSAIGEILDGILVLPV